MKNYSKISNCIETSQTSHLHPQIHEQLSEFQVERRLLGAKNKTTVHILEETSYSPVRNEEGVGPSWSEEELKDLKNQGRLLHGSERSTGEPGTRRRRWMQVKWGVQTRI